MLNIIKNDTIFPDYIKLNLSNSLVNQIVQLTEQFKSNATEALIYSFVEGKNINSNRRKSLKTSFHSPELKSLINQNIIPLIFSMLKSEYPNCNYSVEIGPQTFDYIKYESGGYFEPHRDWVRISSDQQVQYTLLLGLTDTQDYNLSGNTILWLPVNYLNQYDYKILLESESANEQFKMVCQKYRLPNDLIQVKTLFETNKSSQKCIPCKIFALKCGFGLLFQSNFLHSGEEYFHWYKPKEILGLTINITGIPNIKLDESKIDILGTEGFLLKYSIPLTHTHIDTWLTNPDDKFILFDQFESWMCWENSKFVHNYYLFPFQIIISSGTYNNKKFSDKYLRYGNLESNIENIFNSQSDDLLKKISKNLSQIYNETKTKLNTRGREKFIEGVIEEESENLDKFIEIKDMSFNLNFVNQESKNKIKYNLENYINNFSYSNNSVITKYEKVLNTWEESGCNDDGDEYDETTYLHCQIDIKFGFYKLN